MKAQKNNKKVYVYKLYYKYRQIHQNSRMFFCSGMSIEYIQSRNQHCFLAINNFAE